ncbi:hypothetical protein E2A64_07585 [Pseudohoeflea suaedae]|uniref:DUF945 family protein n=1 Tax=Pseudohoeflea suaedae TaxID=877384 RepID=A0A4R5PPD6_9HYPH|nr:hypothetical protein [Pseudohoeflea suaedae]TDH38942.1 hypothetical protein E2A64_07585 [Pseudohoeflea suaedae]
MNLFLAFFRRAHLPIAAALLAGTAIPALALDGDAFATKLNDSYSMKGANLSYDSADVSGSTVTLRNAKLNSPGAPEMNAGDLVFEGVEESDDGGYTVDRARLDDIDYAAENTRVTMKDIEVAGLVIPGTPGTDTIDQILFYDSFSTGAIAVSVDGKDVFSLASADGRLTRLADDDGFEMSASAGGITINTDGIEEAKAKKTLSDLGYDKLTGSAEMTMTYELDTGRVNVEDYSLIADDVGRLNISFDISGYTMELMKAMQTAGAKAAENPDDKAAQQAQGLMMLGLMQQLTFTGAEISFEDASLTSRLLDYTGKQQGISGDQMAQALKGMLPLMLGQLQIPALQQQITAAANVYLDDPGSLTITASPSQAVPFAQIMGIGATDPSQLVDLLDVKVTAND